MILHDFWRSSAAYRVRIALNLKGVAYQSIPVDLIAGTQKGEAYRAKNPQGLVPMLEIDDLCLTQSLAIMDWLDQSIVERPLLSKEPVARAKQLAMALMIAADIHPLNNLRVLKYLKRNMGQEQGAIDSWARHWIAEGFDALEAMADPAAPFLAGDAPGLPDICLIPQIYNARRIETPLDAYPTLVRIDAACMALDAFAKAHPDAQKGETI